MVGGLDLDQKWIITGNEVSLIEKHVCRCQVVVGVHKKKHCCIRVCMGSRQCPKPAGWDILKQDCASMLSHDHNWALCMNHPEFKFVVWTGWKSIDPVSYEVD